MAVARLVKEIGPRFDWLTIVDDAGREWRYRRVGPLDTAEVPHLEGHYVDGHPTRAVLLRDADGHPLLRQDGPGLPRSIVLDHVDDPTNPLLSVLDLDPKEEYELAG
jgi:hypothetical protein